MSRSKGYANAIYINFFYFSIHGISVLLQINITLYVKALNYSVLFVSKKAIPIYFSMPLITIAL